MGHMIFTDRAKVRAMAEFLVSKNKRDRLRIRCLEAEAACRYADLSRLVLPPCGHAPTAFPYGDSIVAARRRIDDVASRLDFMIREGFADRCALLAEEESLEAALGWLEELVDSRFELISGCFDDDESWTRAFLGDRIAYLREMLSSPSRSGTASSAGMIGEVLGLVERGGYDTDYLLEEADTTLGIALLDREQFRYFGERTAAILSDVERDLFDVMRLLPSDRPKTASKVFGAVLAFGIAKTYYLNGTIIPEAAARNFFEVRERLISAYGDLLSEGG